MFTKNDLKVLCQAYDVSCSSKATKATIGHLLEEKIMGCDKMPHPEVFTGEMTSTCVVQPESVSCEMSALPVSQPAGANLGTAISEAVMPISAQDDDSCAVCHLEVEDDWIACDKCERWYHRICGGLKAPSTWRKYSKPGQKWICKTCKK